MRIFFVSSFDYCGNSAGQSRQRQIIEALQALRIGVELVNAMRVVPQDVNFPISSLPQWFRFLPRFLLVPFWLLVSILRRVGRGDVVICFDRTPVTIWPTIIGAWMRGARVIQELTEHPLDGAPATIRGRLTVLVLERLLLRRFDGVMVISQALQAYVSQRAPETKIFRIPAIAVSSQRWAASADAMEAGAAQVAGVPFTFLYAGSLVERKDGVLSLIRAFAAAFGSEGIARLVIIGYGSEAQKAAVRAEIEATGLTAHVTLREPVPQTDLPAWLQAANALVLCRPLSRQASYGFPTKLVEYLSTGRPVVVTSTSDIGHYLRDGESAFLVPSDDVSAFAAAMRRAAADPETAAAIGARGKAIFEAEFETQLAVGRLSDWLRTEFGRGTGKI